MAALAHWSSRLLPVAALLYLLIVVPIALLCGFWQAVIVSLTAVVAQSLFSARQPELALATNPASWIALVVFVLVALFVSWLSSRITEHAREADGESLRVHAAHPADEPLHRARAAIGRAGARYLRS
jgi:K+-sensing histidine kinase KdpD